MGSENALAFLTQLQTGKPLLPAATVISGPNVFLKEYVLDACVAALREAGPEMRHFQLATAADLGALTEAVSEPGLFSPAVTAICRVLRTRRVREGEEEDEPMPAGRGADDGGIGGALEGVRLPSRLIVLYERDTAPAKIVRQIEKSGLVIVCNRPFDSHLPQYASLFARRLGMRISSGTADLIVLRYGANLLAMHNALALAALVQDLQTLDDFIRNQGAVPRAGGEVFALSESLASERPAAAFALLDGALALGRDPFELLAVEIIPVLRRMLTAALLNAEHQSPLDIAMAMGMPPRSPMVSAAINAARRFGAARLTAAYREAVELDARLKDGTIRDRKQALAGLLLHLIAGEGGEARRSPR